MQQILTHYVVIRSLNIETDVLIANKLNNRSKYGRVINILCIGEYRPGQRLGLSTTALMSEPPR